MNLSNHTGHPSVILRRLVEFAATHRDFGPKGIEIRTARRNTCTLSLGGRITVWLTTDAEWPNVVETAAMAFEAMRLRVRENDKSKTISSLGGAIQRGKVRWDWRSARAAGHRAATDFRSDAALNTEISALLATREARQATVAHRRAEREVKANSREAKAATLRAKISSWTRKKKLADTYLRKYTKALKRLEKRTDGQ